LNELDTAKIIGNAIITRLHEHNTMQGMDDAEYIPMIKRIIEAITNNVNYRNVTDADRINLNKSLFQYSQKLYVELCRFHAAEDEEKITLLQVENESKDYFNYIYEHEKHPR